jgi:hypothetical protein
MFVLVYRCEIWVLALTEEQTECSWCSDLPMGWGGSGFGSWQEQEIFFSYCKTSILAVGPIQAVVEGVA